MFSHTMFHVVTYCSTSNIAPPKILYQKAITLSCQGKSKPSIDSVHENAINCTHVSFLS